MATGTARDVEPFSSSNGAAGVLCLHGYTGTPRSMRALAETFADAGLSVELPLLPGHGSSSRDLAQSDYRDWLAAADAAFLELSARTERVVVAGLSMGGALACELALRHRDVAGLMLINPIVEAPDRSFIELLAAADASGAPSLPRLGGDIAMPGVVIDGNEETPIAPMISLFEATAALAQRLEEITCPVLLLTSRSDHIVPPTSGDAIAQRVAGPVERVWLERSYHVATLDFDAAEIEARAVAFALKVLGPEVQGGR